MAFEVIFTDGGRSFYDHIVNYFLNELEDPQVARKWMEEVRNVQNILATSAEASPICDDKYLAKKNIRKIRLKHYKYKIFYEIRGKKVYVKAILHDKQLPEKWIV